MKKISIFLTLLLLPSLLFASPPSSSYTYKAGETIQPSEVQQNETNIYNYLSTGVDTYADSTIVSADIYDGTIVNADISGSAAITYGKLSFSNNIVAGDIATSAVGSAEINDDSIVNADINSAAAIVASKLVLTGITTLTAGSNLDIGSYELRAQTFNSDVATGTAPLTVASTTKVTNLNADTTDGFEGGTGIPSNIQVFTTTGTWTKPAGISTVYVKVWGGGGDGGAGGSTGDDGGGGGGGAGGYAEGLIAVTGNVTVTVGVANGTSSFAGSTTIQATGGVDGSVGGEAAGGAGGAGGVGSVGTINLTGATGQGGSGTATVSGAGGAGGGANGGGGAIGGSNAVAGSIGRQPAGGGGGGSAANGAGGTGGSGMVIVYY